MNLILRENRLICSAHPAKFPHLLDRFLGCKIMHPQKNKKKNYEGSYVSFYVS